VDLDLSETQALVVKTARGDDGARWRPHRHRLAGDRHRAAVLEEAAAYARDRKQFGKPIASFPALSAMLAESRAELDAARLLTLRAAWLKESGRPFTREASMAKLWASEATNRIYHRAVQIHGGYGYVRDFARSGTCATSG
jgi:alkylation response protein AidB-like acyl-CoA dehydrogenase